MLSSGAQLVAKADKKKKKAGNIFHRFLCENTLSLLKNVQPALPIPSTTCLHVHSVLCAGVRFRLAVCHRNMYNKIIAEQGQMLVECGMDCSLTCDVSASPATCPPFSLLHIQQWQCLVPAGCTNEVGVFSEEPADPPKGVQIPPFRHLGLR